MKIGRNDKCWCGSGKKYKACHMSFDNRIKDYWNRGYDLWYDNNKYLAGYVVSENGYLITAETHQMAVL